MFNSGLTHSSSCGIIVGQMASFSLPNYISVVPFQVGNYAFY